ncbi:hypothetical protein PIB30_032233 [Stylosanthes scabra]|uniref:CCHC-type domain-containing protein n=1 Tax=Stylosanthes scabra TaxID=79078 RepID=A0ABU6UAU1_9FABA|nr:hypothetical protein [Stylosanthes scabra]
MRRKKKGRLVSTRIMKEIDLVERAEKRCSLCLQEGHTKRGCPNAPHGNHPYRPRALGDGGHGMMCRRGRMAIPLWPLCPWADNLVRRIVVLGLRLCTAGNGARAADTNASVMGEGTTATRAGSTEIPDTAGIGQGEAAEAGSACKPHHR